VNLRTYEVRTAPLFGRREVLSEQQRRDLAIICPVRLVDWYLGLSLGQKIVVGVAGCALVLVGSYLASLLIFSVAGVGGADSPPQGQTPAPASPRRGASASASASASAPSAPAIALKIERAHWEADRAVVEGRWKGDLSSVHCDLLEGDKAERAVDWWDRSIAAQASFSDRTFSQEFVRAKGRVKDRIDSESDYKAVCMAQFSEGWSTGDDAPIAGRPSG
jgi:hypothetical protein